MDKEQSTENNELMTKSYGIGATCRALILKAYAEGRNVTNEAMALKVRELFKAQGLDVKTGAASIAWYKNDLRKKGLLKGGSGGGTKIELDLSTVSFE